MTDNLGESLQELDRVLGRLNSNSSTATISVNAGGTAVWASVTVCCVMFAINVMLAVVVFYLLMKVDALSDYIQAIYAIAPQLKPQGN